MTQQTEVPKTRRDMTPEQIPQFVESKNPVILEIGCNDGHDTNKLLGLFPTGRIYCFEPDPRAIARFKTTVRNSRALLTEVALSENDGFATFHGSSGKPPEKSRHPGASHYCYLDEWDLSGSLCVATGHLQFSPWTTFPEDRQYRVMTSTLDAWVSRHTEIGIIDFVWMDVQGAEAMVIRGAQQALQGIRYFYTEFYDPPLYEGQPNLEQIQSMLHGFELVSIHGDNALFKNRSL